MLIRSALLAFAMAFISGVGGSAAAAAPGMLVAPMLAMSPSAADLATPVGVLKETVAALAANDVDRLLRASLSETLYQSMRAGLESMAPPSEADSLAFAKTLAQWTAPDAVDQAMVQLQPKIAGLKPQVQAMIASLAGWVATLPPEKQAQAQALVDGLTAWAESNAFDDAQVRAALTALRQTLIDLELGSLEELNAQSYDVKMANLGLLLAGIKVALVEFDLDLDGMAESLTAEPGSISGTNATVKAGVTMFGTRIEGEVPMAQLDGRWLSPLGASVIVVYNDYTSRAQVAEAAMASGANQTAITEYFAAMGEMPEAGRFDDPQPGRYATSTHDADGVITIRLHADRPVNTQIRGYQLTMTPQVEGAQITGWTCTPGAGANPKYLPSNCR